MLELKDVDAGYGGFPAIKDVRMRIEPGESVAVIGANGAGKTTLLRVISGMLPAQRGSILMAGRDLRALPPHRILETGIAHVPENRRLFPGLSVEQNLRMGAFIRSARPKFEERLDYVYALFPRLKERRAQLAGTMSGGEQQMCAIGRALMSDPKLILLDEPSTGLAPVVVEQVFELVRRISADGYTVLIVEQNVRQVLQVVDRAYLLEVGRVRLSGAGSEMLHSEVVRKSYMGLTA
ncbi:MAG: ABC transporter ATP-binding protein [Bosea sp.]|uniref:ABC transporter ATP-binding protein n=1 Tax=Bosea sp. (in: a-proteobacteria) TaxID=1871050 RepID=UPI001AC9B2CF|nr:ABC transporter ATP-binding protein [Bosea sp. (in: a-proteobacteria)]MBN9469359.1 ABC transporter ATP-binding protein [Bosea sp. (in: a-proteobacteria)]